MKDYIEEFFSWRSKMELASPLLPSLDFFIVICDVSLDKETVTYGMFGEDKKRTCKLYKDSYGKRYFKSNKTGCIYYIQKLFGNSVYYVAWLRNGEYLLSVYKKDNATIKFGLHANRKEVNMQFI